LRQLLSLPAVPQTATVVIATCYESGCAAVAVRRCYLCPNFCCADHGTITASGTIWGDCAAREKAELEEAAQSRRAAAKSSGRMLAMLAAVPVAVLRHRR
jgi:hypothetical protein